MKKLVIHLFVIVLVAVPICASAFGKKGHQMVAELGFSLLDENTQNNIKKYLGNISVKDAGTWMDDVRNNPDYNYLKPWHFVNMDKGQAYKPSSKGDVVSMLNKAIGELEHKEKLTNAQIQFDILVIFHLTGDIAQPLHVGYGSDLGGNNIEVTYLSKPYPSNLHKVWDSEMIESTGLTMEELNEFYNKLSDEKVEALKVTKPIEWMNDSRKLLNKVYDYKGDHIDETYVSKNQILVKRQIVYAAIRLSATLEKLFKTPHVKTKTAAVNLIKPHSRGLDTITLKHKWYTSHFVNSAHIPWVVEYTLRASQVNCSDPLARSNKFAPDPFNVTATDLDGDYKGSGYDRGHNMPAADNGCKGQQAMKECFYFSNMFPQTHRLNAGVWKSLEEDERDLAKQDDSIYVWIGSCGVDKTIGANKVVVPKYCWKVIYNYKTEQWHAYIFPNTTTVSGKPEDFETTVANIKAKTGFDFK